MFDNDLSLLRWRRSFVIRLWIVVLIMLALSGLLVWRWYYLQVEQFTHFDELSSANQVTFQPVAPLRGNIYDRNNKLLVGSKSRFYVKVSSDSAKGLLPRLPVIKTNLEISDSTTERLEKVAGSSVYAGDVILNDYMTEDEVIKFIAVQQRFPEAVLNAGMYRTYPYDDLASHLLGHVARINPDDKKRLKQANKLRKYSGSEFIGKRGVEANYESRLHGSPGLQEAYIDAHGRVLKAVQRYAPQSGDDLWLTIDFETQQFAEGLLSDKQGSIVVLDPYNGAILALASAPRFDPNEFIGGITQKRWDELNSAESGTPMVHRSIYGQYAPGSTIKPFMALAALEQGWRKPDYTYFSKGFFALTPSVTFKDWKASGHGKTDITKSIVRSVNSFYYQLAYDIGVDGLHEGLSDFGFGQKTGVDIGGERSGVLPTEQWKLDTFGERWYPGDTIPVGVGQGYIEVTPLQLARAMAMIANGGYPVKPKLVLQVGSNRITPEFGGERLFAAENVKIIRDALAKVTQPGGTAYSRVGKDSFYPIAGKTGTAQVTRLRYDNGGRVKNEELPEHLRDHAWFVGFAPAYNPRIVVVALVEHGGSGGRIAGPLVRSVMDFYLLNRLKLDFGQGSQEDGPIAAAVQ